MTKFYNFFTLLVLVIFSLKTFALESTDTMKTKILRAYNKNILVLNRGLEDSIVRKDHIKLTSSDGFIARGICLKSTMQTSHWKIYRVTRPNLVSKDTTYNLKSINQSEMPSDLLKYSRVDFTKYLREYGDKEVNKVLKLQKKRIARYDLPTSTRATTLKRPESLTGFDKMLETNFSDSELAKDLSRSHVEIYADPLSWETRQDKAEYVFGAAIFNFGKKYQYSFHMDENQLKYPGYVERSTHYDLEFVISRYTQNLSIVSRFDFDRESINDIHYPTRRQQVGLFGFRYHVWEEDPRNEFMDITYVPTYDFLEYANYTSNATDDSLKINQGIRHVITIRSKTKLTEKIVWGNKLIWKPLSDFKAVANKSSDSQPSFNTNFSYFFSRNFSIEYDLKYESDKVYAAEYGLPTENVSNNFQIRYAFRL
jgi:hypothetical protein